MLHKILADPLTLYNYCYIFHRYVWSGKFCIAYNSSIFYMHKNQYLYRRNRSCSFCTYCSVSYLLLLCFMRTNSFRPEPIYSSFIFNRSRTRFGHTYTTVIIICRLLVIGAISTGDSSSNFRLTLTVKLSFSLALEIIKVKWVSGHGDK